MKKDAGRGSVRQLATQSRKEKLWTPNRVQVGLFLRLKFRTHRVLFVKAHALDNVFHSDARDCGLDPAQTGVGER